MYKIYTKYTISDIAADAAAISSFQAMHVNQIDSLAVCA